MDMREYFEACVAEFKQGVASALDRVGQEAVEIAKESTAYHDVTGNLRASNSYQADENGLTLLNTADYASEVEARTGNVLADAVLYAKNTLEAQ